MIWNPKRLLWLLPTVLITTLVSFWLVGGSTVSLDTVSLGTASQDAASQDTASLDAAGKNATPSGQAKPKPTAQDSTLPTFFNTRPESAERAAWEAALGAAQGNDRAATRLLKLGGAALPHILPRLDQLDPMQRERVALALLPLARRLGALPAGFTPENGKTATFWLSFWEEHFVNFRELSVRRAVSRYLDSPTPAHERDLVVLDTFALGELMYQLSGRARQNLSPEQQTKRVALIARYLSHVTQGTLTEAPCTTLAEANHVAEYWIRWWSANRYLFTSPHGVERFLAPLLQTRYAAWARETASRGPRLGLKSGANLFIYGSAWLLTSGLFGCVFGAFSATFLLRRFPALSRFLLELPYLLAPGSLVLFVKTSGPQSWALAACALAAFGALLSFRQQTQWQFDAASTSSPPTATPLSSTLRQAIAAVLVPTTGALVTAVVCVESVFKLNGIGAQVLTAIADRDVTWVVGFSVCASLVLGLLQLLSDRLLRDSDSAFESQGRA